MPNHYVGDLLPTLGISGLSRVRTELLELAIVVALAPHPVQMHRQLASHRHLGNLSSAAQRKVEDPLRHRGWLRTVTCAASTSRNRSRALPCLRMGPERRRSPLDSSDGTSPTELATRWPQ